MLQKPGPHAHKVYSLEAHESRAPKEQAGLQCPHIARLQPRGSTALTLAIHSPWEQ